MSSFYDLSKTPRKILNQAIVKAIVSENNGALFDPSDLSTLYQDAGGTTPVTAVEQPVGKMLDKSGNGYHATQRITASRPTLSARYNLLTKTEDFSGWILSSVSFADGLLSAAYTDIDVYLRYDSYAAGNTTHKANSSYTFSAECKKGTTKWVRFRLLFVNENSQSDVWFDLDLGIVGYHNTPITATIESLGDGYYKCTASGNSLAAVSVDYLDIAPSDADGLRSVTAGASVYVRKPNLRLGTTSGPYQRVNTATDYDTDERYFQKYLRWDAVDDFMNLPFMNLYGGGSASIVCARDAVSQTTDTYIISERSTTDADPKYFPSRQIANAGNMDAYITDDAGAIVLDTVGSPFSGVANAVIRSIVDSGNNLKLFKNGVLAANDNYTRSGTLTLNNTIIGASVSTTTSNYAAMKLYGLIVTKSALTDAQRVACERYLGRKSGVQL